MTDEITRYRLPQVSTPIKDADIANKAYVDAGGGGLPALLDGKLWIGNGSDVATAVIVAGDGTIDNAGLLAIGLLKITNGMLAGSITTAKILNFATDVTAVAAVVANTAKVTNATHTSEVTGATALILNKVAITNKALVTGIAGDHVLIADASDSDNLKKVNVSDFLGGGGSAKQIISCQGNANFWNSSLAAQYSAMSAKTLSTNEALVKEYFSIGGDVAQMKIFVTGNGAGNTNTCTLRVNGANKSVVVSIGAGLTGLFEDVTNSATISEDDACDYAFSVPTTDNIAANGVMVEFSPA